MVTLQILVLSFLVRIQVAQQSEIGKCRSRLFMLTGAAPTALRKRRIPMQDSENPAWGCHIIRAALLTGQSVDHIAKAFEHLVHRSVAVHAGILASLRIVLGDHLGLRER